MVYPHELRKWGSIDTQVLERAVQQQRAACLVCGPRIKSRTGRLIAEGVLLFSRHGFGKTSTEVCTSLAGAFAIFQLERGGAARAECERFALLPEELLLDLLAVGCVAVGVGLEARLSGRCAPLLASPPEDCHNTAFLLHHPTGNALQLALGPIMMSDKDSIFISHGMGGADPGGVLLLASDRDVRPGATHIETGSSRTPAHRAILR